MDGSQLLDVPSLPDDLAACHGMIQLMRAEREQLLEQLNHSSRKLTQMEYQLQQVLQKLYGRSSEKIDPRQMALFSELLKQIESQHSQSAPSQEAQESTNDSPAPVPVQRAGHGRGKFPDNLPRERIIHDLPEKDKPCPCCGTMRAVIGAETSEQLEYVPATAKVIEHVRLKYMCKSCEKNVAQTGPQIVTAEKPLSPIEKGLAGPGLLAYVAVSKYDDSLPLHRMEKIFRRHHIDLPRSTQWDIVRQGGDALVPLHNLMIQDVLLSKVIHTDDTPVNVRDKRLDKTRQGRFWVYLGDADHPHIVFDYTPSRSRDGPMNFLKNWGREEPRFYRPTRSADTTASTIKAPLDQGNFSPCVQCANQNGPGAA